MASEVSGETSDLLNEAIRLHHEGELTKSERLYKEVLEREPEQTVALGLLGVIAAQFGNLELAIQRVRRSIAIDPNQPGALNNLGNMLAEAERYDEAIDAYERSIHFDPDDPNVHLHLGHVYGSLNRHLEAVAAYKRATDLDPSDAALWNTLGWALDKIGRLDDAIAAFQRAMDLDANYISPKDGMGKVFRQMGRLEDAFAIYQQWLAIEPDNPIAQHFALVCRPGESPPDRASSDYVKQTFDVFAERFESLLTNLDYRAPELLANIIEKLIADDDRGKRKVVDLGCGTGLCASYLRKYADRLVGVDLSAGMLARARQKEQYDELIESELTAYLDACEETFDLMISADTLIYIGDLRSTFDAASRTLRPGGLLVFSLEKLSGEPCEPSPAGAENHAPAKHRLPDDGYQLGTSGRYQHTEACVRTWLEQSGFSTAVFREAEVRKEGHESVTGFLVAAHRNEAS
ncbi:tetratricopeptide repeat protein [Rhodopirellula sp. JC639]|uniref:tetratricopeptide repeat protein n=1 Tax=Stieleria mannarensis TaxID=2755585 RepID=UPI00160475A1|nr:tetratricopeptide repeat protein [Rhodopirellula sp. JC639]